MSKQIHASRRLKFEIFIKNKQQLFLYEINIKSN